MGNARIDRIAAIMPVALLALVAGAAPAVDSTSHSIRGGIAAAAAPGTQLWVSHYHGSARGINLATSAAVSPDRRVVFVTGASVQLVRGSGGRTFNRLVYATIAYNAATGAKIWVSRYATSGHRNRPSALSVSPDGKTVYVSGTSVALTSRDYATVAYNAATGAQIWASRLPAGPGNLILASSLAVGPQGHTVYITGPTTVNSVTGYTTVAYRAASGAKMWLRRHTVNVSFMATSMTVSPTGRTVFVAEDDNGGPAFTDVAYNALTGATEWTVHRGGFGQGSDGITVAASPDGARVFVAETSGALGSSGGVLVFGYNAATGAQEWVSHLAGASQLENSGKALAVSPDGRTVYAIATNDGGSTANVVTTAYDAATGLVRWSASFPNSPVMTVNRASALAVNPDGKSVYVTINTARHGSGKSRFTTIGYGSATGAQLWASSDTEFSSLALSAAVSSDGRTVFAAGSSGAGQRMGYTTIAYRA